MTIDGTTHVVIGGIECVVDYVGKQGGFKGLDQLNVQLPPKLPSGLVEIKVRQGTTVANTVQILVQ